MSPEDIVAHRQRMRADDDRKARAYPLLVAALQRIATGESHYGAQAFEYKMEARHALVAAGESWPGRT